MESTPGQVSVVHILLIPLTVDMAGICYPLSNVARDLETYCSCNTAKMSGKNTAMPSCLKFMLRIVRQAQLLLTTNKEVRLCQYST